MLLSCTAKIYTCRIYMPMDLFNDLFDRTHCGPRFLRFLQIERELSQLKQKCLYVRYRVHF